MQPDREADVCSCGCQEPYKAMGLYTPDPFNNLPDTGTIVLLGRPSKAFCVPEPETMPSDMADALMRAEFAVISAMMRDKLAGV